MWGAPCYLASTVEHVPKGHLCENMLLILDSPIPRAQHCYVGPLRFATDKSSHAPRPASHGRDANRLCKARGSLVHLSSQGDFG